MPTPASHTLDELEIALDAAAAHMQQLSEENARLRSRLADVRGELAEASERMRSAGYKLRVVAERLPQAAVAINANGAELMQEKAA